MHAPTQPMLRQNLADQMAAAQRARLVRRVRRQQHR